MTKASINVVDLLGPTLDSRDEAKTLFEQLNNLFLLNNEVVLDCSEIEFMSRSFADEFHQEKLKIARNTQTVILIENATAQVIEILQAVARTQNKKKKTDLTIPVFSISSNRDLTEYLQGM
jgi:anti-anti-sigma regulatory factor